VEGDFALTISILQSGRKEGASITYPSTKWKKGKPKSQTKRIHFD